jgi:hypothetical protein
MRFIYSAILLLLLNCYAWAGRSLKVKAVLRNDSSLVQLKHFNDAELARLKQKPEFQYNGEPAGPSLWSRFWRWFWHLFDGVDAPRSTNWLLFFLKYLFISLGIAAIVFIILKLAGVDVRGLIKRKPVDAGVPFTETLENIHEIDFELNIDQAIAQHNYRLAVRLLYLKALKQLSDAQLIHWQIDKTNAAYVNELANPQQREAFAVLTRQFEYVWYGEFAINKQAFQNIKTLFGNFKQTLA